MNAIEKVNKIGITNATVMGGQGLFTPTALEVTSSGIDHYDYPWTHDEKAVLNQITEDTYMLQHAYQVNTNMIYRLGVLDADEVKKRNALITLNYLTSIEQSATFANYTDEQSIMIELYQGDMYYMIESFDDGDVVFLARNIKTEEREVFDLTENTLMGKLKAYLLPVAS